MKIDAIQTYYQAHPVKNNARIKNTTTPEGVEQTQGTQFVHLSFKGNPDKIPTQIAAFATESNYLSGIYATGGLADVAEALPGAIGVHAKDIIGKEIDARTFLPYYSLGDPEGRIYVVKAESADKVKRVHDALRHGQTPKEDIYTLKDFKLVDANYKLQAGEQFALLTQDGGPDRKVSKFFLLKDCELQGEVERMSEKEMKMEKVHYRLFEVDTAGTRKDRHYIIHTPEHAKGRSAYGVYPLHAREEFTGTTGYGGSSRAYGGSSGAYGGSSGAYGGSQSINRAVNEKRMFLQPKTDDMFYTEQLRAYEQLTMEGKMNIDAHGKFNPQNHMLHDRFCYMTLTDVAQGAKNGNKNMQGLNFVELLHNPGGAYQGKYWNPLDFFRIVATNDDLAKLQANENYKKVTEIAEKIEKGNATEEESTQIFKFFKPYFSKFMDSEGNFNMTMMAVRMTDENPKNSSLGNVSKNYGKETRNPDTVDIARGLTEELRKIENKMIDVVNGSKKANMATDKQDGFFGSGSINELMKTKYKTYKATDTPDAIFNAKLENKKTLINAIAEATDKLSTDPDAIAKTMFSKGKMEGIRKQAEKNEPNLKLTLGGLSKYDKGDMLFISWGRPDPQKGFPITLEAFEAYLKDETVPLETRKHTKIIMGAGGQNDAFSGNNADWKAIKEAIERIGNIEVNGQKGVFKGNACYVNGLFPGRLVNCSDLGIFTSRFEPCGITPFECYASGAPVISTNTGGAPDFVKPGKTGFLTKDPFMLNPEKVGLPAGTEGEALDNARKANVAKQIAEQIKAYVAPIKDGTWEAKQKEYIKNCVAEKIEWHNNNAYNGGRSALEIYLKDKFNVMNNDIPMEYASDMRGEFDNSAFTKSRAKGEGFFAKLKDFFSSKSGKWTAGILGTAAILSICYTGYKKGVFSTKYEEKPEEEEKPSLSQVA